jgi:amylosucrase
MVEYFTGEHPYSDARGEKFMYNPKTQDARISGTTASLLGLERALETGNKADIAIAIERIQLMYGLVFAFGGIPILYYGDEIGYTNDYSYKDRRALQDDNRWMHRPKIDWERMERRHQEGSVEQQVYRRIQRMVRLRKALGELAADADRALIETDNEHVLAFLRFNSAGRTLVVANVSDLPQYTSIALLSRAGLDEDAVDCISQSGLTIRSGNIVLEPYQLGWLRRELPELA